MTDSEVPAPRASTDTDSHLWAVHTIGMDDLHPCASRRLAIRNATWLNLALCWGVPSYSVDLDPLIYNVPVMWEGDPAVHARYLIREDRDPRWSDPSVDVIGALIDRVKEQA